MVSTKQREAASKRLQSIEDQLRQLLQENEERKVLDNELVSLLRAAAAAGVAKTVPTAAPAATSSSPTTTTTTTPAALRMMGGGRLVLGSSSCASSLSSHSPPLLPPATHPSHRPPHSSSISGMQDLFVAPQRQEEDGSHRVEMDAFGDGEEGMSAAIEQHHHLEGGREVNRGEGEEGGSRKRSPSNHTSLVPPHLQQLPSAGSQFHQQPSVGSQFLMTLGGGVNAQSSNRTGQPSARAKAASQLAMSQRQPFPLMGGGVVGALPQHRVPPQRPSIGCAAAASTSSREGGESSSAFFSRISVGNSGTPPNNELVAVEDLVHRKKVPGRPKVLTSDRRRKESGKTLTFMGHTLSSLDAESRLVAVADIAYIVAALLTSVFAVTAVDPNVDVTLSNDESELPRTSYIVCYALVQVLTMLWVGMRFFVRTRTDKWTIVDNLDEIRALYLRSWFIFDLAYALPIELLFLGWFNPGFYYSLPRHFLRFLRFGSLVAGVNPLTTYRRWFRFVAYVAVMIFVSHCCAHLFLSVTRKYEEGSGGSHSYIDALYWTIATLTSVGYGDLAIKSQSARVLAVFVMSIGVVLISTFTALATDFLTTKDSLTIDEEAKKNHMAAMLALYNIPWELQRDVIHVFPSIIGNDTERQFREAVGAMPPFIRERLMMYFNAHHLKRVSLFADVAAQRPELLLEVTKTMQQRVYAPYEFIVQRGDPGQEMYIILNGTVDVSRPSAVNESEDVLLATLSRGDWFGEQAMLADNCVRSADIVSMTTVEVLVLEKGPMTEVLKKCPDILNRLVSASNRRTDQNSKKSLVSVELVSSGTASALASPFSPGDSEVEQDVNAMLEGASVTVPTPRTVVRIGGTNPLSAITDHRPSPSPPSSVAPHPV